MQGDGEDNHLDGEKGARRGRKPGSSRKNGGAGGKGKDKKQSGTDSEQEVSRPLRPSAGRGQGLLPVGVSEGFCLIAAELMAWPRASATSERRLPASPGLLWPPSASPGLLTSLSPGPGPFPLSSGGQGTDLADAAHRMILRTQRQTGRRRCPSPQPNPAGPRPHSRGEVGGQDGEHRGRWGRGAGPREYRGVCPWGRHGLGGRRAP
uniref:Uncharacterized protein n=1 Tax=Sarcophilus harrisii TaxID=9305 RepID=A0A7N4NT37_SARHA